MNQHKPFTKLAHAALLLWVFNFILLITMVVASTLVTMKKMDSSNNKTRIVFIDALKGNGCLSCYIIHDEKSVPDFWIRLFKEDLRQIRDESFRFMARGRASNMITFSRLEIINSIDDKANLIDFWLRWRDRYHLFIGPRFTERHCACGSPPSKMWLV